MHALTARSIALISIVFNRRSNLRLKRMHPEHLILCVKTKIASSDLDRRLIAFVLLKIHLLVRSSSDPAENHPPSPQSRLRSVSARPLRRNRLANLQRRSERLRARSPPAERLLKIVVTRPMPSWTLFFRPMKHNPLRMRCLRDAHLLLLSRTNPLRAAREALRPLRSKCPRLRHLRAASDLLLLRT